MSKRKRKLPWERVEFVGGPQDGLIWTEGLHRFSLDVGQLYTIGDDHKHLYQPMEVRDGTLYLQHVERSPV